MKTMYARRFTALIVASCAALTAVLAQDRYPNRPVKVVVGYAAGGAADVVARITMNSLSKRLGQPIIIENKPGSGGNIAAETVVHAAPDGYTLHLVASSDAINASLQKRTFDLLKDLAPVAGIISLPVVLVVNTKLPVKTFAEFVAYARANVGKVNVASPGTGTTGHLEIEVLNTIAKTQVQHVPYRSGGAINDVISGQVQGMYASISTAIPHILSGSVRALYVTSDKRNPSLPDVPAVTEVKDAPDLNAWFGLDAPASTPAAVIGTVSEHLALTLAEPEVIKHFADLGGTPLALNAAGFGTFLSQEVDHYGKAIKESGATID
jgi:tripartite-type tricarboxylate transporter receptor subunit TctC